MATRKTRYSDYFILWERLIAAILVNLSAFPHLEPLVTKLQGLLEDSRRLTRDQDVHAAAKQEASKELLVVLANGNKLATALQGVLKEHYGNRSEKLVEFGIQPFRGRQQAPVSQEPEEPQGPEVETLTAQPVATETFTNG